MPEEHLSPEEVKRFVKRINLWKFFLFVLLVACGLVAHMGYRLVGDPEITEQDRQRFKERAASKIQELKAEPDIDRSGPKQAFLKHLIREESMRFPLQDGGKWAGALLALFLLLCAVCLQGWLIRTGSGPGLPPVPWFRTIAWPLALILVVWGSIFLFLYNQRVNRERSQLVMEESYYPGLEADITRMQKDPAVNFPGEKQKLLIYKQTDSIRHFAMDRVAPIESAKAGVISSSVLLSIGMVLTVYLVVSSLYSRPKKPS